MENLKKNFIYSNQKVLLKREMRTWFAGWYKGFDSFIMSIRYNRLSLDHCAYYKRFEDNDFIILLLYVDDMLVACPNKDRVQELKA